MATYRQKLENAILQNPTLQDVEQYDTSVVSINKFIDLQTAVHRIGSDITTLVIPRVVHVNQNITIPANITLYRIGAGQLSVASGFTVLINGPVISDARLFFSGLGTVTGVGGVIHSSWFGNTGTPEGVIASPVGSTYSRSDGGTGTTLYVKESGTGDTGWVAVSSGGGGGGITSIRGRVSSTGTILSGTGFTVSRTSTGTYIVTYDIAFSAQPTVVVSISDGFVFNHAITGFESASTFTGLTINGSSLFDDNFAFIAMEN